VKAESQDNYLSRSQPLLFARESAVAEPRCFSRGFFIGIRGDSLICMRKYLILLILLACSMPPAASAASFSQAANPAPGGRLVTDETGRQMTIPANVRRIVTLAPNLTETIYALGAADRLVGDTNYCDTPPEAKSKPHIGNPQNPNLEAIVALHPDLVLATTTINVPETADTLLKLGIAVYTSDPHTVRGVLDSIAQLGDLIGAKAQGETLQATLRARLDALQTRLSERPPVHVLFLVWIAPPISIGSTTFIADALRWAGAESILVTDQNWPQPAFEEVLRLEPDYIVLTTDHEGSAADLADLRSRADWKKLAAVRFGRVVTVSDEIDRPSPGLVDAIEQLAHDLHPEAFTPAVPQ
jgi:iron complex transport system substrate-binding protein